MERLCLRVTSLTDASVHDEDSCVRFDSLFNLEHLIEKGLFLLVSSRGINNNDFIVFLPKEFDTFFGYQNRISLVLMTKERALNLCSVHFELLKSASPERVSANETNPPSSLHVLVSKLGASGGLSRALKTDKHDDIWLAPNKLIRLVFRAQHPSELVNDNLKDDSLQIVGDIVIVFVHVLPDLQGDCFPQFHDVLDIHI